MSKRMFCYTAHLHFEADSIDDAFAKLSDHFLALSEGDLDSPDLLKLSPVSNQKIEPLHEDTLH